ncbi:MAG: hypothetical protein IPL26_12685 [Leptospiraceae bacterium]|nr:hypothetical protein [Leptospiraceae bacterium]
MTNNSLNLPSIRSNNISKLNTKKSTIATLDLSTRSEISQLMKKKSENLKEQFVGKKKEVWI